MTETNNIYNPRLELFMKSINSDLSIKDYNAKLHYADYCLFISKFKKEAFKQNNESVIMMGYYITIRDQCGFDEFIKSQTTGS